MGSKVSRIQTPAQCATALVELGVGEETLVLEGLWFLEEEFDKVLTSRTSYDFWRDSCSIIFSLALKDSIKSVFDTGLQYLRCHHGIAKFVHGLVIAGQENKPDDEKRAALIKGAAVFKGVCEAVARKHENNQALQELVRYPGDVFSAWHDVFMRRRTKDMVRRDHSLIINLDADTAEKALAVFKFLMRNYPKLQPLMRASLPLIQKSIQESKDRQAQQKMEDEKRKKIERKVYGSTPRTISCC